MQSKNQLPSFDLQQLSSMTVVDRSMICPLVLEQEVARSVQAARTTDINRDIGAEN